MQRLLYLDSLDKVPVPFQRGPVRRGLSPQDDHDICLPDGLGCGLPRSPGFRSLGRSLKRCLPYLKGYHVLVRVDNMSHQGGLRSHPCAG